MPATNAEIEAINDVLARHGYRSETIARECAQAAAAAREGKKRGTRLPDDWWPNADDWDWGMKRGWANAALSDQAFMFRNYWTSKTGKDATKLNWSRTWQNWILNARRPHGQAALPPPNSLNASKDKWREAQQRFAEGGGERGESDVFLPTPAGSRRPNGVHGSGGRDFFNLPAGSDGDGR